MANGDPDQAKEILDAPNAKKVKQLLSQLRCTIDWDSQPYAKNMMYNICLDKFNQVKECNQAMHMAYLDGVKLVEAVPKGQWSTWGTGLLPKSAIVNIKEEGWQGDNQLGHILTQIMHEPFDEWSIPKITSSMGNTPPGTPPPEPSDSLGNKVKPQKTSAFSRQCITRIANLIYTCFI